MNKIYQRIDWENYPSSATPLNEDNLNKMDYAIDKLDDRIVTHETTKLNTATGNTLVKNVTFNEKTGVFTIEKLSGSKITINTALEKISTNFHFNPTTQKLVLTLIDGTVQEIDLSALITQYDFIESDTITFEIDANGKVKANILNGSITGEKLEPNYLANVTLQAKNAKTSADNAKTSEKLAYQYAEEAKESASQTAKSDAKNITYDNTESGLSATNVKDALDEVAQGSVSAIAIDTTITDSTNAPLIYGKFKGYIKQQTYSGKNLLDTSRLVEATKNGIVYTPVYDKNGMLQYINCNGTNTSSEALFCLYAQTNSLPDTLEKGVEYIVSVNSTGNVTIQIHEYTNNAWSNILTTNTSKSFVISENATGLLVRLQVLTEGTSVSNVKCYPMIRLASITDDTYEPYTGGIASPNPDYPQSINGLAKDGAIEVKTCGKNLFDASKKEKGLYTYDATTGKYTLDNNYYHVKVLIGANVALTRSYNSGENIGGGYWCTCFDASDTPIKSISGSDLQVSFHTFTTPSNCAYIWVYGINSTTGEDAHKIQIELGAIATEYEPYTETTAAIPTDAPLYEGDYLEVYADGSGKLVRDKYELTVTSDVIEMGYEKNYVDIYLPLVGIGSGNYVVEENMHSTHFTGGTRDGIYYEREKQKAAINSNGTTILASIEGYTTLAEYKAFFDSEECKFVYKLAEPTETPITAEQVEQFKKLYTFEPVTNVLCDGEVEIQYYKNTPSGVAVGTVHKMADNNKATYDGDGNVITETYAKQTDLEKVIDGTTTVAKATQDADGNNIVNTYAKKSSVLSTLTECEASTNASDIASAVALGELSDFLGTKILINNGGNNANDITNNGFTLFIVPYKQSGWKYSTKIENAWYFVLSYRLNADNTTQHWFGLTSRFNYCRITRDGGTTWGVYAFEGVQK